MFRLPQNLSTQFGRDTGADALENEILAEKAASLGRAGRLIGATLKELKNFRGPPGERSRMVQQAADAVHGYFVQRELCGFVDHSGPIEHYAIPGEVLARVGAR